VARRRNGALTQRQYRVAIFAFVALLLISFLVAHPWVSVALVALVGAAAYWWWWVRPRRRAIDARALVLEAERVQREHEESGRRDLRERSLSLGGLLALTAREFEVRAGEILSEHGYDDIEHVGGTSDLGIDLFATDPSGARVGIQCKRYAPDKLVGAPEVRLLYGDMTHAAVRGVFVTTSGYTAAATAYAESHSIVLIDGARLAMLVSATLPEPPGAVGA